MWRTCCCYSLLFVVVVVVVIVYCYMYRKISSYTKDVCDATRSNKIVEKRYTLHDSEECETSCVVVSPKKRATEWMKRPAIWYILINVHALWRRWKLLNYFPPTQFINSRRSILQLVLQSECSKAMHQARLCMNIIQ